jgi:hypothetical protein
MFLEQLPCSCVVTFTHWPVLHVGWVFERVRVPVLSQVPVYPPHAPQLPYVAEPHVAPSALRVHARFSVVAVCLHAPAEQAYRLTVLVSSAAVLAHGA